MRSPVRERIARAPGSEVVLAARSLCPMLAQMRTHMPETYLVATDATDAAVPALRVALQLAAAAGASVLVLHVLEIPGAQMGWSAPLFKVDPKAFKRSCDKRIVGAERMLRQQLTVIADPTVRVDIKVVATESTIAQMVVAMARTLEVGMIIIGKGREQGSLAVMAERIARLARRPVLIVPCKWTRRLRARGATPQRRRAASARVARVAAQRR